MTLPDDALPLLTTRCLVGGAWMDPGGPRLAVHDPATGAHLADVPDVPDAVLDDACGAAAAAFGPWRARAAHERAAALRGLADAMRAHAGALAALITAENGKPLAEAHAEVRYATSFVDWFAGEAVRVYGETVPGARPGQRIVVVREPVGPCGLITPWNFPAAMLTRKLAPALAAGCTVVAKPAEQTPLTALALARLCVDVGVPAGVVNVVTGDGPRLGGGLCRHRALRKLSFTGSTEVGRLVQRAAADDLKRVTLELGGNAPFVVFDDADLDRAVAGAMVAKFRGGGQTCVAANRFLLQRGIAEAFTARLVAAAAALRVGPGAAPGTTLGPVIDDAAARRLADVVADAVARGATVALGPVPDGRSRLIAPVVLTGVTPAMRAWREELFGPVVAIAAFDDEEEAIARANDTDAGLVAYAWTGDLRRGERLAARLEVGMVGLDEGLVSNAAAPFGGVKHSGYGREGGRAGLDDYLQLKYVCAG